MFHHKSKFILLMSFMLLSGCSDTIGQRLAPDPDLQEQQQQTDSSSTNSNSSTTEEEQKRTTPPENSTDEEPTQTTKTSVKVSEDIPSNIPIYRNAEVVNERINPETNSGEIELTSEDATNLIAQFYQQQLTDNNWQIVEPFSQVSEGTETITARSDAFNLTVTVSETTDGQENTAIALQYQPVSDTSEKEETTKKSPTTFTDLEKTPEPLVTYVREVAKLGVLSPIEPDSKAFAPNEAITRRTFARWLFEANNRFYRDRASQQVRPVSQAQTPAFQDVPPSDPDFAIIQGLAEAGIIPSRLTGDATIAQFRPDAVLTREVLLLWKVPLDTRSNLPSVDVTTVQETWGFQDAGKIDPKALGAIVADFSKGEQSNIRRLYGYTQLLQPEKPVTRAEAAAALWSFGTQGETVTAKELISDQ